MPSRYAFLIDTYATERLKTLSVWSQFLDADLSWRIEPRARSPLEQMVHQCVSEDLWMRTMLGIEVGRPALPEAETRLGFLQHYAAVSAARLEALTAQDDDWFERPVRFFDVERPRTWVLVRRLTHSAHHRGQLTACLRALGRPLYSTYGPTADTGGLLQNAAPVIYRYVDVEDLLGSEALGGRWPDLPGPGSQPPSERP